MSMVKKKTDSRDNELYPLPSSAEAMRTFISKFKVDMMEHIVSSIKFAVDNKHTIVEVFQFSNSPFVVTIAEEEFEPNLVHINQFYSTNQMEELCPRIESLLEKIKERNNEKENPESGYGDGDDSPSE